VCELLGNEVGLTSVCRVENNFLLVVYDKARDDDSQKSVAQAIPTTICTSWFQLQFQHPLFFSLQLQLFTPKLQKNRNFSI
jgi:hypothetical protein